MWVLRVAISWLELILGFFVDLLLLWCSVGLSYLLLLGCCLRFLLLGLVDVYC